MKTKLIAMTAAPAVAALVIAATVSVYKPDDRDPTMCPALTHEVQSMEQCMAASLTCRGASAEAQLKGVQREIARRCTN